MSRLTEIRDRLNAITAELSDEETTGSRASELAAEAAELTAEAAQQATAALDRLERES